MKRVLFGVATLAAFAVCSGTVSAQAVVPAYPGTVVPAYSPPVAVSGTVVTPGVAVSGVISPPIVVAPVLPPIRVGFPYYGYGYGYGRPYYYPHYYRRW
jgi:hypothetical protein